MNQDHHSPSNNIQRKGQSIDPSEAIIEPAMTSKGHKVNRSNPVSIRQTAEEHVRFLAQHYQKEIPEWMKKHGDFFISTIRIAVNDVCLLEEAAISNEKEAGFWKVFHSSSLTKEFFPAVVEFMNLPPNKNVMKPLIDHGMNSAGAWALVNLREMLRDGYDFHEALEACHKEIGQAIAKGEVWLFFALLTSMKQPPRRSLNDWIIKAWLPLALWQDSSGDKEIAKAKRQDVKDAYEILKTKGARLVALNDDSITKAIGTVTSKIRNMHR